MSFNIDDLPQLDDIVSFENLPEELQKLDGAIQTILSNIHYNNYSSFKSHYGDYGSYSLNLVFDDELKISIPGTNGMRLIFNPAVNNPVTSEVPLSFSYQWDILKYRNQLTANSFVEDPIFVFKLLLKVLKIPADEIIKAIIDQYFEKDYDQFVSYYNSISATSISVNPNTDFVIDDIINQIKSTNGSLLLEDVVINKFISIGSLDESFNAIEKIFGKWIKNFSYKDLAKIFIPKLFASIDSINIALEFPRSVFVPVITNLYNPTGGTVGDPVPEPYQTRLTFNVGSISYSTENGFEFNQENSFDFQKSFNLH